MDREEFIEEAARDAVGNWKKEENFCWFDQPEDADNFMLWFFRTRDSGIADCSNAEAIEQEFEKFLEVDDPDCFREHSRHWAVGWVEGLSIRVYRDGKITDAFRKFYEIKERLEEYPLLNEEDVSAKEYEATLENIRSNTGDLLADDVEDGWESDVFSYLSDNYPEDVEPTDGGGGWPDPGHIREALIHLRLFNWNEYKDDISDSDLEWLRKQAHQFMDNNKIYGQVGIPNDDWDYDLFEWLCENVDRDEIFVYKWGVTFPVKMIIEGLKEKGWAQDVLCR